METSASLLEQLRRRGDDADSRRLVELYTPLIRRWLGRHVRQADDVNDLTQQVFAVVVGKLPTFVHSGRPGAFRSWLRGITTNHLRAYWRGRRMPEAPADLDGVLDQLEDPASDLSRQWDREHDEHVAHKLLEQVRGDFHPATWRAFCRLVLDGDGPAAVASELGLSVNAVLIAKSRVLARLRQHGHGLID